MNDKSHRHIQSVVDKKSGKCLRSTTKNDTNYVASNFMSNVVTRQLRRKKERKDEKTNEHAIGFISREINSANKDEIAAKLQERLDNDESFAVKDGYAWLLEDTKRIFHSTLRNLDDVNLYTSKNPGIENRVWLVYFRWNRHESEV